MVSTCIFVVRYVWFFNWILIILVFLVVLTINFGLAIHELIIVIHVVIVIQELISNTGGTFKFFNLRTHTIIKTRLVNFGIIFVFFVVLLKFLKLIRRLVYNQLGPHACRKYKLLFVYVLKVRVEIGVYIAKLV